MPFPWTTAMTTVLLLTSLMFPPILMLNLPLTILIVGIAFLREKAKAKANVEKPRSE